MARGRQTQSLFGHAGCDKKAVWVGDMDADMRGNVATFENEMGRLAGRMEAGLGDGGRPGGWRHSGRMEAFQEDGDIPGG